MKKGIRFLAVLALSLLAFGGNGVFAEGNTPSFLTQELTEIDVEVTDRATFHVGSGTNNATVSPITVTNNLKSVPVVVTNIRATANAGYTINTYSSDFASYGADSKHFGIAYSSNDISGSGYTFEDELAAEGNKAYNFTGKSTVYTSAVEAASNTQLANIIFTVGLKQAPKTTAMFDTGKNVNIKLKALTGQDNPGYTTANSGIVAIERVDTLPDGFIPTTANTISATGSNPIYAWFDTDTIYYFSGADILYLNSDSSYMFASLTKLNSLGDMSSWNTSEVTDMSFMFRSVGYGVADFSLDLSGWDTSKVTSMSNMFKLAGYNSDSWSVGDISGWDTSKVTNMYNMFSEAGYQASSFSLNLSGWNTSSVTNMSGMFSATAHDVATWSVGDISHWNTSSVTTMGSMFVGAGYNSTDFSLDLSGWDTSNVTNMYCMFQSTGTNATTFSLGISEWNTSSVTNMGMMFNQTGLNVPDFSLDLSGWDTSNVTNMQFTFSRTGGNATNFSLNLSGWNTSNVTNMGSMVQYAGDGSTSWSITIPKTNGNGIPSTTRRLYGSTTSNYTEPSSGRFFTLAP